MTEMSRLHVCVELSFDPSGILMEIDLLAGCKLFTGVTGRKFFQYLLHLLWTPAWLSILLM